MKSTTWICILCLETALSLILTAAVLCQWHGLESHLSPPATSGESEKKAKFTGCSMPPTVPTPVAGNTAICSTRKGVSMNALDKYSDVTVVAATICAEAGGEPFAGQVAVGNVIGNRARRSGATPRAVCLAPRQFSCWNNRGRMVLKMQTMKTHPAWADCVRIAEDVCSPYFIPLSKATHYFNPSLCSPSWARGMKLVTVIQNHRFYREN